MRAGVDPVPLAQIALNALASGAIAGIAYKARVLDLVGTILAFLICFISATMGHWSWLLLLLIFVGGSFLATRFGFHYKLQLGVEESEEGTRGGSNVLSNGTVPALVALAYGAKLLGDEQAQVAFTTALAVAAADTLASEIGVLAPAPVLITSPGTRVVPGTDGGISAIGSLAAALSALSMSMISLAVFVLVGWPVNIALYHNGNFNFLLLLLPAALGFAGCQLDSVLGATAEKRGWLGNGGVNFVAISVSVAISLLLLEFLQN